MCQTVGTCLTEDPYARPKDAFWEAKRFLEAHPQATYEHLEAHLKLKRKFVHPDSLRRILLNSLADLEKEGRWEAGQQTYRQLLGILPK